LYPKLAIFQPEILEPDQAFGAIIMDEDDRSLVATDTTQRIIMKIVEHTDQSLHIADQNRQCLWGLLFATPFLVIGLGTAVATAKTVTLECRRANSTQVTCQRTVTGILGTTTTDRIPGQLQTANVVKAGGTGVVLGTTTGKVELAPYHVFVTNKHQETADRLNAFLKDPQQATVRVEQDDRLGNSLFIGNFLLGSLGIAIVSLGIPLKMSCRFDRPSDQVTITKKYLYGERQTILPLSTIQQSQISRYFFYLSVDKRNAYSLNLIQNNGKKVSLSVPSQDLERYQEIADTTNHFLGTSAH
jgi:hypothetical protein